MNRFRSAGTILVLVAIALLVIMINPFARDPLETSAAPTSESESETAQEAGDYTVSQTLSKASPEDAYVQVDDLVFSLGYRERLSTAIRDITAAGRYTVEGYDAGTAARSAEVCVYQDDQLRFTLYASSIKEYADNSGVSYSASLFAADEEQDMVLTGIRIADAAMPDAWIFSGNRMDGSNIRKEAFMTRFGSYSQDKTVYPSLVQKKTDAQNSSVYVLSVEVNATKQEVLPARVLAAIHSLRTLQYTFTFDDTTQECVSVDISCKVSAEEISLYWEKRGEEAAKKTSTTAAGKSGSVSGSGVTGATGTAGSSVPTEPAEASDSAEISSPSTDPELSENSENSAPEAEDTAADAEEAAAEE